MRVALVHDWLSGFGGSEQVLLSLSDIYKDAPIFTSVYSKEKLPQFKSKKIITSFIDKLPYGRLRPQFYLPLMPRAFESFDLSEFDLVISDSHCCSKGAITKPETLHICYCHTPIRYIWMPHIDPRLSGSFLKEAVSSSLRVWDYQAAQRPDKILANSKEVSARIFKYYRKKAEVIYPPVKTSFFAPLDSLNKLGNYFLYVGRLISYKKPDLVVRIFNELNLPLKIIGDGPEYFNLKNMAKKNIEFLGKVEPKELKNYYARALAFIFPGYEDFGIVAVEAMASGRPVIAFEKGGMREVVKEGISGIFFKKQKAESLKEAILGFKPENFSSKKIAEEAKKFDESIFKKKIAEYIQKELNQF